MQIDSLAPKADRCTYSIQSAEMERDYCRQNVIDQFSNLVNPRRLDDDTRSRHTNQNGRPG